MCDPKANFLSTVWSNSECLLKWQLNKLMNGWIGLMDGFVDEQMDEGMKWSHFYYVSPHFNVNKRGKK